MATFTVTTTADSGTGSLREAVALANADGSPDDIVFDATLAGKTIVLTGGPLVLSTSIAITGDVDGDHKADITLSGGDAGGILMCQRDTTEIDLRSLTLTGGYASQSASTASGAAINADDIAKLRISDCTFSGNRSMGLGGAIYVTDTEASVTNSLLTGNYALGTGGAIFVSGGKLTLTNSTVHSNGTYGSGGGVTSQNANLWIIDSTVTANGAGFGLPPSGLAGGVAISGGYVIIANSVVSENVTGYSHAASDVSGSINLGANSVFGTAVTIVSDFDCLQSVTGLKLGELLDNGGTVLTRGVLDGSLLIDAGLNSMLPTDDYDVDHDGDKLELMPRDGRGLGRMWNGTVDIGAVEYFATDTIRGTAGANHIFGGIGDDRLSGLGGNDVISGGADNDTISGGAGRDRIAGDAGKDKLTGDGGRDTFVFEALADTTRSFNGADRIADFTQGQDRIDLSLIDGDGAGTANAFDFIGSHAFSRTAGELRVEISGRDLAVRGDVDGDGRADFSILLVNDSSLVLTAGDFIL